MFSPFPSTFRPRFLFQKPAVYWNPRPHRPHNKRKVGSLSPRGISILIHSPLFSSPPAVCCFVLGRRRVNFLRHEIPFDVVVGQKSQRQCLICSTIQRPGRDRFQRHPAPSWPCLDRSRPFVLSFISGSSAQPRQSNIQLRLVFPVLHPAPCMLHNRKFPLLSPEALKTLFCVAHSLWLLYLQGPLNEALISVCYLSVHPA